MSAVQTDTAKIAGAAFALAAMGRECPGVETIRELVRRFGPGAVHVALQVQARLIDEQAAALEAFGAIRTAKGSTP